MCVSADRLLFSVFGLLSSVFTSDLRASCHASSASLSDCIHPLQRASYFHICMFCMFCVVGVSARECDVVRLDERKHSLIVLLQLQQQVLSTCTHTYLTALNI